MTRASVLVRKYFNSRTSRRDVSSSSPKRTSTSPQRFNVAAPQVAASVKPFSDIPGPLALPMLRHSCHVLPRIGSYHHTVGLGLLDGLRDKYGDLVRLAKASRTRPVLYVFDPELMREVYDSYLTEPPTWDKSPHRQHRRSLGTHCPIKGDETKAIWAAIRALLLDETLLQNFEKSFDDIAKDTTDRLGDLRLADNALNEELETELYRWALETIGVMIFGIRLGCLEGATHKPTLENRAPEKTSMDDHIPEQCSLSKRSPDLLNAAEKLVRCSRQIADGSYLVRSEHTLKTDSPTFNAALKILDNHFSLTEQFLRRALEDLGSVATRPEQILLDKLRPLEQRILPLAADVLLAGVEPLVQTAVSMFYQLSLHAAQQQRAHDQVRWAATHDEGGRPDLSYVSACAREALRLHPATGGVVRRSREDLIVGGYEIPAGVDIVLAHGVTSKSEKQWGRAKSFIPERWCSDNWGPLRAARAHPLATLPFGETCPATGVVSKMLAALATRVLDKYRLEWHGPPPSLATTGVNRLQSPYYFVLQNAA